MGFNKEIIKEYLANQMSNADFRANGYIFDGNNKKRSTRNIFKRLQSHLNQFLEGNTSYRWVVLTGLRGAGKTTVMYQLYNNNKNKDAYFLVLSVDQIISKLKSNINEVLDVFEEIIGRSLSNLEKPLFLFLDEVQYDKDWGMALKTLYDRTDKVFIFSTGSAAVLFNANCDIARRPIWEKIYPLSFTEFIKIKHQKKEIKQLSKSLKDALFSSQSGKEVFERVSLLRKKIDNYYINISSLEFENYLYFGSLPFMVALNNEALIYDQINKSLERVVNQDIPQMRRMTRDIISIIPAILYAIADMDQINFTNMSKMFKVSRSKISEIFSILEQTEVLHRIYPIGSHLKQAANKPSKYLFSAPAFRAMYYKTIGNTITQQNARGKLLEDLVSMYFYQLFDKKPVFSLNYDYNKGGADFVIGIGERRIVVEVGSNKKEYRQIIETSKRVKPIYSIIISEKSTGLEYNEKNNAVKVPLKYFLLV